MFTVVYEKIGVAGSHGTQDHTIDSFPIIVSECKTNLDFFINKCRHDINKHNFNRNTKFSNLSSEETAALQKVLASAKT